LQFYFDETLLWAPGILRYEYLTEFEFGLPPAKNLHHELMFCSLCRVHWELLVCPSYLCLLSCY